jgi:hypothetical protein
MRGDSGNLHKFSVLTLCQARILFFRLHTDDAQKVHIDKGFSDCDAFRPQALRAPGIASLT